MSKLPMVCFCVLKCFKCKFTINHLTRHSPCNARDGSICFIHPREVKNTFQVLETGDSPNPWIFNLQPSQMCISSFYNRVVPLAECHAKSVSKQCCPLTTKICNHEQFSLNPFGLNVPGHFICSVDDSSTGGAEGGSWDGIVAVLSSMRCYAL